MEHHGPDHRVSTRSPLGRNPSSRRTFLTASAATAAAALATPLAGTTPAAARQTTALPTAQPPDPTLRDLLTQVDPDRIQAIIQRLTEFGTRHTLSSQTDPARGIGAATAWVFDQMTALAEPSGGRITVAKQTFTQQPTDRIPEATVITNVLATVTGQVTPERVYVITGHLDSRVTDVLDSTSDAPGADDDASGVAVVMELVRLFATVPTEATLVLATVTGEEQGLFGSAHMAAEMAAASTDVQAMFSNDIVGASQAFDGTTPDPHTLRLFVEGIPTTETPDQTAIRRSVGGENDGPSRQLARFVTDVADNRATDMRIRTIWRRDRYLRGSDHISFLQQGYPAARFTEPRENFNHEHQDVRVEDGVQFGDLAEFCDFDYIARVARVNLATLYSLSEAPGTPKGLKIEAAVLTNQTTLNWQRGAEPDLAGYQVVWRETTAPEWEHVIDVGDVTTVTLDMSKDNVQFGLRAVDRDGHHSPVAFPEVVTS